MKTVIIDSLTGIVLNVGAGAATSPPPDGIEYEIVIDSTWVQLVAQRMTMEAM